MSEPLKSAVRAAVLRLLDPLVKWLLEAGMGVGDFLTLVKLAYVHAAREQAQKSGLDPDRPNVSRIAVVTGLTRKEVASILIGGGPGRSDDLGRRQRAERVLSGWWSDPTFQDSRTGEPAILPIRQAKRSFTALVERYSGERWWVGTILEELLRVKAVRRLPDGKLKALSRTYATVRWDPDGVIAFGDHVAELTATLLHNLKDPAHRRYVRRIVNTRLDPRYVPMLRRDLEEQAEGLADSQDDALNAPRHTLTGKRGEPQPASLGLTVYVFEAHGGDAPAEGLPPEPLGRQRKAGRRGSKSRGLKR
jgi:Family of unknown function (DUF6502)